MEQPEILEEYTSGGKRRRVMKFLASPVGSEDSEMHLFRGTYEENGEGEWKLLEDTVEYLGPNPDRK